MEYLCEMRPSLNEIKSVKALSSKKERDERGLFVVEGEKLVSEAVSSGYDLEKIYRKEEIGDDMMERMSMLKSGSPVLAVVRQKRWSLDRIENGLYLFLDSIRDPGNLGTIIRIADWFGIKAIVASPDTVELYNPKTVQATMGAIFRVKVFYSPLADATRRILSLGGSVYGTFLDGENMYSIDNLRTGKDCPVAIVIGNEANGICDEMGSLVNERLYIPPYPENASTSESLNAAVATAIIVSEFRRRSNG